jgi:hypothetical protein
MGSSNLYMCIGSILGEVVVPNFFMGRRVKIGHSCMGEFRDMGIPAQFPNIFKF